MSMTTQQSEAPSGDSFLTMKQVTELTRYSRPSIYRLIRDQGFPTPAEDGASREGSVSPRGGRRVAGKPSSRTPGWAALLGAACSA